jgi:drug/metabolite transporter (DMT)-like permease
VCWAANTYTIHRGAVGMSLFTANALRFTMALGLLLPGLVAGRVLDRRRAPGAARAPLLAPTRELAVFAGTASIEAFGGGWMLLYALSHGDLGVAAPLTALAPLFAVPIGVILGTERPGGARLCATAMAVLGSAVLVVMR